MRRIPWINLLAGVWLMIAAYQMGTPASANNVVIGILLVAACWWLLAAPQPPAGVAWFQVFCGAWLMISPFVLKYTTVTVATANALITGLIVIVIGLLETSYGVRRTV